MLITLRENQLCKISTRHRKNSKQSGIVAIDSCFALFGARQYGATTREKLWWKISAHSDFKPWPRTLNTHRITPYHVSSGGQERESKCQVDVSQRNKELAKTNLKNMDRTMQELQHIGSIKDLRPKTCRVNFHEVRSAFSKFSDDELTIRRCR